MVLELLPPTIESNIRSYISVYVLLILLNELGKEIKCEACQAFFFFCNEFNISLTVVFGLLPPTIESNRGS